MMTINTGLKFEGRPVAASFAPVETFEMLAAAVSAKA
jgi:hypothetical protein